MLYTKSKRAFTMIELVFVIVIIGILSAIAVPKLAATRDDAIMTKAKATIGSVRSAIATERQKRILRGNFDAIYKLSTSTPGAPIFDGFDGNASNPVLDYAPSSCSSSSSSKGCWVVTSEGSAPGDTSVYTYKMPILGTVAFTLSNNRFTCPPDDANCKLLTQ